MKLELLSATFSKLGFHVWYENATPQALEALRRTIFVGGDSRSLPTISIVLPNRNSDERQECEQQSIHRCGCELGTAMTEQNWPGTFEREVLPHLDTAYNLARWLTRNEQDAQDSVQEAYLRAFRFFPASAAAMRVHGS
jgi:Sigma-70 region 2